MRKNQKGKTPIIYHYDPVCRKKVRKQKAYFVYRSGDEQFLLCCPECQAQFEANAQSLMDEARRLESKTNKKRA
jgi:YHS domain-containing protein